MELTHAQLIGHVFDHPVLKPHWWFRDDADCSDWPEQVGKRRILEFLTRFFTDPADVRRRFTRDQIDQGLHYLVSSSCSGALSVVVDRSLPLADRIACIGAMKSLYANLMAPVYGWDLGHTIHEDDPERPMFACYMWWEVNALYPRADHPEDGAINAAVFDVFRATLKLREESCLESVLHGLGHWHLALPQTAQPIVEEFLRTRFDISDALRAYAHRAADGAVQ